MRKCTQQNDSFCWVNGPYCDMALGPPQTMRAGYQECLRRNGFDGINYWRLFKFSYDEKNSNLFPETVALQEEADKGNSDAQFKLGSAYAYGQNVIRNPAEALKWYRKSAEQGNVYAQFFLGTAYYTGNSIVPKEEAEAMKWYKMAADQGNMGAQLHIGLAYESGRGEEGNFTAAAKYFRMAAEQGDLNAYYRLGRLYENGNGVPQDYQEAYFWYSLNTWREYDKDRQRVAALLTAQQRDSIEQRAKEWKARPRISPKK